VAELASLVVRFGFADSQLIVLESLGGESECIRYLRVDAALPSDIAYPVAVGIEVAGNGPALPLTPGIVDTFFEHDGQITKHPVRALTLAALAPRPGERLWDIGTGSGSIAIEWLLAYPDNQAIGFEHHAERAARARSNAQHLGVDWLEVKEGDAPDVLNDTPLPDAVFIGGGLSHALLEDLWQRLPVGVRVVVNAVTLESEALLAQWQQAAGGDLFRF
jgi:precorrin-6Y C5,15-methyltransferase (decarboxylating)